MAQPRKINSALDDALKEMGRATTPEDLSRRGVRKVRAVGMREVSLLIERAVNRTLVERTLSVSADEVADLVDAAQSEFTSQLKGLQDLADSRELLERHKTEWRSSLDDLRGKVAERRAFIEQREFEPSPAELREQAVFEKKLRQAAQTFVAPDKRAALLAAFTELHMLELASQRDAARRAHDAELSLLERRLAKVVAGLEGAESALERAATARAVDLGLGSVYSEVQGLPSAERGRELKSALMASIFEANLELRQRRGLQVPSGAGAPTGASPASPDQTTL